MVRVLVVVLLVSIAVVLQQRVGRRLFAKTLEETVVALRTEAGERLRAKGARGPFAELVLVADKAGRRLDVLARATDSERFERVLEYPILAASGTAGPKLREGDRQVPEGVYRVLSLNPNSRFHLSLELDYPNAFDRARASEEGRTEPGSDIFIHGGAKSVGCLAIGDPAIEEVFLLVAETGIGNVAALLCPSDPKGPFERAGAADLPVWVEEVDARLDGELRRVGLR
ncbi:MAG: L,D-transpeptidase family protein [Planctomycetota bacterium]